RLGDLPEIDVLSASAGQLAVVLFAARGIRQDVDGFRQRLKFPLGASLVRAAVAIRMLFARELAETVADFLLRCATLHAQHLVVIDLHSDRATSVSFADTPVLHSNGPLPRRHGHPSGFSNLLRLTD